MTTSLIPQDKLTRRQVAKVLALMIRDEFEKARAERLDTNSDDADSE